MEYLPEAFKALDTYAQFILWKTDTRNGKLVKLPLDYRDGSVADAHRPDVWTTSETACQYAAMYGPEYGVGFVFTEADPFFFVDIDKCLNADDKTWSPLANELMALFSGASIEVSQSGRGLHIIGTSSAKYDHSSKNVPLGIELYTAGRFVALTGTSAVGNAGLDHAVALGAAIQQYFLAPVAVLEADWTDEPCAEWRGHTDDDKLIKKAYATKSNAAKMGVGVSFADLWDANEDKLGTQYPDPDGYRPYDGSSADAALAQHLAFWTGNDCERITRIMQQSALVRDKWERTDYLPRTILRATALQTVFYTHGDAMPIPAAPAAPMGCTNAAPVVLDGFQYLAADQQIEHFKGCFYIQDIHRVLTPNGDVLKPDQFRAIYGGYTFVMDAVGEKTTCNAWEAFTESQLVRYPKAASMCFRPQMAPGAMIEEAGRALVNAYVPYDAPVIEGDVAPFLSHLAKVLPVERDREILLAYMAACIQYKGVKFQWAPLLQGIEGNGKTLFTRCIAYMVGKRYTHYPKAGDIDNKFNGWLLNKLFIGVEDIFVAEHRREVIETLKPMITGGDGLEIQLKGVDQITADICANLMLNSNHRDAIRKTRTDRRFCVFYTAQQRDGDLDRAGMLGDYFPNLYAWLNGGGYAVVGFYLANYAIPDELNPATSCHRAPETSSTTDVLTASLGSIEQHILEAIDEGRHGFAGGWVSSLALDRLIVSLRADRQIPPNKRRELMRDIGYDWHPALPKGRVNNVLPEGGKPKLYIKKGALALNLTEHADVVSAYIKAQGDAGGATLAADVFGKGLQ